MPHKFFDVNVEMSNPYRGWLELRNAIFRQAFEDYRECSLKSRRFIQFTYSKLSPEQRQHDLQVARKLHLRWVRAAEIFEWFHSPDADRLLIDTKWTGADIWRMSPYGHNDHNRGGILDKPYRPSRFPTFAEQRTPLPERFNDQAEHRSFASAIFAEVNAARANQKRKEKDKENGKEKG